MCGIVRVVVVLRASDREPAVEHVLEAERRTVSKGETLKGRRRVRVVMIEACELDKSGVAEIERHRAGLDDERFWIEAVSKNKYARLRAARHIKNLIAAISAVEDVCVLAWPADEDVIACSAYEDVVASIPL